MATKVNRDYWSGTYSAVTDFDTGECYRLDGSLKDWIDANKWKINNGDEFDLSVCPWGLPECSFSSMATPVFMKTGGFGSSSEVLVEIQESHRKNTPIFFNAGWTRTTTDSYNADFARISNKRRIVGETEKSNTQTVKYTNTVENNSTYSLDEYGSNTAPVISFQYDSVRYVLGNIFLFDTTKTTNFSNTYSSTTYDDLYNLINTESTGNKYLICGCYTNIYIKHADTQNNTNFKIRCCGKAKVPEYLGKQYFDFEDTDYIDLSRCLYRLGGFQGKSANGSYGYTYSSGSSMYSNEVPTIKTTKSLEFGCSATSTCIANISSKKQVFDDVSYHWEARLYYFSGQLSGSGQRYEIKNGDTMPIHSGDNAYWVNPYTFLIIDSHTYGDNYKAMCAALRHELAFIGLPFATSQPSQSDEIGDNNIYVPVFDYDHMITTGNYKSGADALLLPNASWGDVFDSSVPAYDPSYIPPEPEPDQGDTGDLDNQKLHNLRYNGSNNYYLLNESELTQFIGFINGLYAGESDPEKKRSIDFMGSNPTDYIVGIYGCGIELTPGASTSIKLGAVDTSDAGIFGRAVPTNLTYVNFGDYDIPAYGNFLDFKPYTTIEVYVPLCGTIEVDPGEYIGHNLKVDGLIDYQTGELTARIVRDGKTVTNTLTGSMWVQLPVTAAKMGDYQNNQHQLRMQMLSSVLSFGQSSPNAINSHVQSAAGAIAGSAAGGSPTALATPGKAQFTIPQNAASTALSLYNTHYQITHTQPARATASSASAGNALEMYHHAMIFIKRPTFLDGYDPDTYAHTIGHACCISAQLSSFSGYTVFSAADLDNIHTRRAVNPLQATAQEKQLLKQTLQTGIYINTISPE